MRTSYGVQNAAMHRLQTVAHVGQCAGGDNAHRVFDERLLHLAPELGHLELLVLRIELAGVGGKFPILDLVVIVVLGDVLSGLVLGVGVVHGNVGILTFRTGKKLPQVVGETDAVGCGVVGFVSHVGTFLHVRANACSSSALFSRIATGNVSRETSRSSRELPPRNRFERKRGNAPSQPISRPPGGAGMFHVKHSERETSRPAPPAVVPDRLPPVHHGRHPLPGRQ